jgi:hypothetical protein
MDIEYPKARRRIAELEAENERLKCCGNCKYLKTEVTRTYTIQIFHGQSFPTSRTMQCSEDGEDILPWYRNCHFAPSLWAERGTP